MLCAHGNIQGEGDALKILFQPVTVPKKAQRTSKKRVYAENGSYTYTGDVLKVAGQLYDEQVEITGSDEGNATNPKFSLLKFWRDIVIPKLEELCKKHGCIIRHQEDNAGPHRETVYRNFMMDEFTKRGWIYKPQPPQAPITNTNDSIYLRI